MHGVKARLCSAMQSSRRTGEEPDLVFYGRWVAGALASAGVWDDAEGAGVVAPAHDWVAGGAGDKGENERREGARREPASLRSSGETAARGERRYSLAQVDAQSAMATCAHL